MSTLGSALSVDVEQILKYRTLFPKWSLAKRWGLLCFGGDLSPERLLAAYSLGIFPWYNEGDPIYWWFTNPRAILRPEDFHLPKRSLRTLKHTGFRLTMDQAFAEVVRGCAAPREDTAETWITEDMFEAYTELHRLGYAHSIETWLDDELVGGLYGLGIAQAFFGESMFHLKSEASRLALYGLIQILEARGIKLLDCQQETPHMVRMGSTNVPGKSFQQMLQAAGLGSKPKHPECWQPWGVVYEFSDCSSSWRLKSK